MEIERSQEKLYLYLEVQQYNIRQRAMLKERTMECPELLTQGSLNVVQSMFHLKGAPI